MPFSYEQCSTKRSSNAWQRAKGCNGVREREHRKEGEGRPAIDAPAAMDPNPVVMLVVGLLAATTVTDDRICSQTGHCGRIIWSQSPAQSDSSFRPAAPSQRDIAG